MSFPVITLRSTELSVIAANRITPPLDPSLLIAKARAVKNKISLLCSDIPIKLSSRNDTKQGNMTQDISSSIFKPTVLSYLKTVKPLTICTEVQALVFAHIWPESSIDEAVNVSATRTADCKRLSH